MDNKTPRLLRADEISCRVQSVTDDGGAIILLYKDARVDMNILDETYGPMNWQRAHCVVSDSLFCAISIWDESKHEWVVKQDVGVESQTEKTKGEASDAFKRAGFNWGIGRELYTGPFIFVKLEKDETRTGMSGKLQASYKFGLTVTHIAYNDKREITELTLKDKKGKIRYSMSLGKPLQADEPAESAQEAHKAALVPAKLGTMPYPPLIPAMNRDDKIKEVCKKHSVTTGLFGALLAEMQLDGRIPKGKTAAMSPENFELMLTKVVEAITKTAIPA